MVTSSPEIVERAVGRDLGINIFWPDDNAKRSAVILLHGGGWARGHRDDMHGYARILRARGFLVIASEYRLIDEAPWPAQIIDVKDTIRWVRRNADWLRIDPEKIALQGFSAGGHLAMLAAATADKPIFGEDHPHPGGSAAVGAVVALFAPPALTRDMFPVRPPPVADLLGDGDEEVAKAASPLHHIGPSFPPTFLLNGMADPMMPYQVTLRLFERLTANGTKVDLHLYHGHTHEFSSLPSMLEPVQAEVALFLDRAMTDPEFYQRENLALNMFARPGGPPGGPPVGPPPH
jgi:acetyl esterase/lipase